MPPNHVCGQVYATECVYNHHGQAFSCRGSSRNVLTCGRTHMLWVACTCAEVRAGRTDVLMSYICGDTGAVAPRSYRSTRIPMNVVARVTVRL